MIESADEFFRLRTSPDPSEQQRAAHESVPEDILLEVIEKYPEMKEWVALNKQVPLRILRILANDDDSRVRSTVAMKRKLDEELFLKLANDTDESVRHQIACNKKTSPTVLKLLADDSLKFVACVAKERLSELKADSSS